MVLTVQYENYTKKKVAKDYFLTVEVNNYSFETIAINKGILLNF